MIIKPIAIFTLALLWGLLMLANAEGDPLWGLAGGVVVIGYAIQQWTTDRKHIEFHVLPDDRQ